MKPHSGNQRPDLLTSLMNMSLVLCCHGKCIFADPLQMSHACHRFLEMPQPPHVLLTFDKVHNPLRLPRETTSERPKVVRTCGAFKHFDLEMCFATTGCTFRHRIFRKCSDVVVFCTFLFRHVLRATQRRAIFHLSPRSSSSSSSSNGSSSRSIRSNRNNRSGGGGWWW